MMAGTDTDGKLALAVTPRAKPFSDLLRQEFLAYKEETGFTHAQLAAELGLKSSTAVTKYLSGKPEGDVVKLEGLIDDVMRSRMKRREARAQIIPTNVTKAMEGYFETLRETNICGVIRGASGVGKSCACGLYAAKNPTCILIVASDLQPRGSDVVSMLWDELKSRSWSPSKGTRLGEMFRKLAGSQRLLIVDDAHRLSRHALGMVIAVHNRTGIPIALVGYDDLIERKMVLDAQNYSRLGPVWEVALDDHDKLARHLIEQFVPDSGESLVELAVNVIGEDGHARALLQRLLMTRKSKELTDGTRHEQDWPTAFRQANACTVRPCDLNGG